MKNQSSLAASDLCSDSELQREYETLLKELGMKDWKVGITNATNGLEAIESGGHITAYINPDDTGRMRDHLVDLLLFDEYGAMDVNNLTDGQMADYFAKKESQ
jgi:hypothetical protein